MTTAHIPGHIPFLNKIFRKINRLPLVMLSITSRCNSRCTMCRYWDIAKHDFPPFNIFRKDNEEPADSAQDKKELLELLFKEGKKGINVQRYKGLGEMNPDQLWHTTMNPEKRNLLQVKIEDMVDTDEIFTVLMGEEVEPRREFIQNNALEVSVLDI